MVCYVGKYWDRYIHWACELCLVRPMCNEQCHRTKYKHSYCESCDSGCSSYPCNKVEMSLMFASVYRSYGHTMMEAATKHFKETSIFRMMRPPDKSFDKWWTQ